MAIKRFKRPFFGLKWKRLREWVAVLQEEGRSFTLQTAWHLLLAAGDAVLYPVKSDLYRHRLTVCQRCPLFDPGLKRCRPFTGSDLGCGCYVPYRAISPAPCWGRERDANFGWD